MHTIHAFSGNSIHAHARRQKQNFVTTFSIAQDT